MMVYVYVVGYGTEDKDDLNRITGMGDKSRAGEV